MRVITCISDRTNRIYKEALEASCNYYGYQLVTLDHHGNWKSNRLKDNYVEHYLESIPNNELVLFTDGYDAFFNASESELINKFYSFDSEIVISAEINCYPCNELASHFKPSKTDYRYLNSGGFIGYVSAIKKMFSEIRLIQNTPKGKLYMHSNQYLYSLLYLSKILGIKLDTNCLIFQTFSSSIELHMNLLQVEDYSDKKNTLKLIVDDMNIKLKNFQTKNNRLINLITGTTPCHLHFTGPFFKDVIFSGLLNDTMPWSGSHLNTGPLIN